MQQPTTKTSVSKCVALGRYAAAMLGKLTNKPALLSFAASMTAAIDSLEASQGAYAASVWRSSSRASASDTTTT